MECKRDNNILPVAPLVEDYLTVNRFENHGGGWGYSGHSVEAIRFMCDNDILLGNIYMKRTYVILFAFIVILY